MDEAMREVWVDSEQSEADGSGEAAKALFAN